MFYGTLMSAPSKKNPMRSIYFTEVFTSELHTIYDIDRNYNKKDLEIWAIHTNIHNFKFSELFLYFLEPQNCTYRQHIKMLLLYEN